jgi:hypothetical protein
MRPAAESTLDGIAEGTYTSTGVKPPWVTEQQIAPARANLLYSATPESFSGVLAAAFWMTPSSLTEPVDEDGAEDAIGNRETVDQLRRETSSKRSVRRSQGRRKDVEVMIEVQNKFRQD